MHPRLKTLNIRAVVCSFQPGNSLIHLRDLSRDTATFRSYQALDVLANLKSLTMRIDSFEQMQFIAQYIQQ